MVLDRTLSEEEQKPHRVLINKYFSEVMGVNPVISYHDSGAEKGVYKVEVGDQMFLAAAAALDRERSLLTEYNILNSLYKGASELFPRPIAHYNPADDSSGDLLVMEFLPHQRINHFQPHTYTKNGGFFRALAKKIGESVAIAHAKTGRYSSEPHDGNIIVKLDKNGDIDLRFVDAIQFKTGSLETAVRQMFVQPGERPECFRFIHKFREGLADGVAQMEGVSNEEALARFNFLREYNPIF